MLQRSIVKELLTDENKIIVRIPMFETAGANEALFTCNIANQPGIINGYKVGDIVMVDFENNDLDSPIIVGNFYTGLNDVSNAGFNGDSLNISGHTVLSSDFTVGNITYNDLLAIISQFKQDESSQYPNISYTHQANLNHNNENFIINYEYKKNTKVTSDEFLNYFKRIKYLPVVNQPGNSSYYCLSLAYYENDIIEIRRLGVTNNNLDMDIEEVLFSNFTFSDEVIN